MPPIENSPLFSGTSGASVAAAPDGEEKSKTAPSTPTTTTTTTTTTAEHQQQHEDETKPAASPSAASSSAASLGSVPINSKVLTNRQKVGYVVDGKAKKKCPPPPRFDDDNDGAGGGSGGGDANGLDLDLDPREVLRASIAFEKSNGAQNYDKGHWQQHQQRSSSSSIISSSNGRQQFSSTSVRSSSICSITTGGRAAAVSGGKSTAKRSSSFMSESSSSSISLNNSFSKLYPSIENLSLRPVLGSNDDENDNSNGGKEGFVSTKAAARGIHILDVDVEQTWASASIKKTNKNAPSATTAAAGRGYATSTTRSTTHDSYYMTSSLSASVSVQQEDILRGGGGGGGYGYAGYNSRSIQEDEKMLDYAFIPSERDVAAAASSAGGVSATCHGGDEDEDLIAMKRAAAYGGSESHSNVVPSVGWNTAQHATTTVNAVAATSAGNNSSDRAAVGGSVEATVLDYSDFAHPSEQAVQAEFMCEGGDYDHRLHDDRHGSSVSYGSELHHHQNYNHNVGLSTDVTSLPRYDTELPAEATVISSGPTEKATQAAWSSDATEALVLQSGAILEDGNAVDLDTKPPAQTSHDTQHHNISTSVDQFQSSSVEMDTMVDIEPGGAVAATVVDYDIHPGEMTTESVQAEFLGRSAMNIAMEDDTTNQVALDRGSEQDIFEIDQSGDDLRPQAAEATVVDSGPIGKATAEAWSTGAVEPAEVLREESGVENIVDNQNHNSKDIGTDSFHNPVQTADGDEDMTGDVAEVVGITEDIHPAELETGHATTAELVGTESNIAVAVHSDAAPALDHQVVASEHTDAVVVHRSQTTGVHEMGVASHNSTGECVAEAVLTHQSSSVTTIPDGQPGFDTPQQSLQEATPVAVMAVEESIQDNNNTPRTAQDFYDYPVKPEPMFRSSTDTPIATSINERNRAISEPVNGIFETTTEEPAWTRAPSFGGTSPSEDIPEPLVPPMAAAVFEDSSELPPGDIPPAIPVPHAPEVTVSSMTRASGGSQRSDSRNDGFGNGVNTITNNIGRGASNVMEILFGDTRPMVRRPVELDSLSASVFPRTLLPSSVIYSEATKSWVATINTNQKALETNNVQESSKSLRAFSVPTKKQAICLSRAWSPPRMNPFADNPKCSICEVKFAVFRRASHCRNCGVCVCSNCTTTWPSKMLPATYNIKREGFFHVCKACDMLSSSFRLALIDGDFDQALALFSTDNVNLTCPFANVKGELFYPVHCAVLGGNLKLLKWLVDEHCCPLRSIRVSSGRQGKDNSGSYTPILTSKGRSLLAIALGNRNIGIVRYLVVEKKMMLWAERDLSSEVLVQNLDLVLRILPEEVLVEQNYGDYAGSSERVGLKDDTQSRVPGQVTSPTSQGLNDSEISAIRASGALDDDVGVSSHEDCIICFSNPIDTVVTPCGHQICCQECSKNISRCPVCSIDCTFIRVFRA